MVKTSLNLNLKRYVLHNTHYEGRETIALKPISLHHTYNDKLGVELHIIRIKVNVYWESFECASI